VERAVELVPGAAVVAVVGWWSLEQGGYDVTTWAPGALFLLGLAAATVRPRVDRESVRLLWAPVALLAAFCAWSYASIAWATVAGDAWTGANRTALYLVVFFLAAGLHRRREDAVLLLTALSATIAVVGLYTLFEAARAADPAPFFVGERLSDPVGYPNATAALYLLAFWPAAVLASRREVAPPLRLVQVVVATTLLSLSAVTQSRGATYTLPMVLVVALLVVPGRLRLAATLIPIGAATALALPTLWDVYTAKSGNGDVHGALVDALQAVLLASLGAGVVAASAIVLDVRARPTPRVASLVRAAFAGLLAAAAVGGAIALLVRVPHPVGRVESAWASFKHGAEPSGGSSHFVGLGSNRYDFWRVSWRTFERHPLAGVGVDNFAVQYARERRSLEQPKYPHSLEFRLLTGTGIVGTLLFAAFLAACAFGVARRGRPPATRAVQAAAGLVFASWLLHGSVDWLWEFPALTTAAFAALGLGLALARGEAPAAPAAASRAARLAFAAALAGAGVAVAASIVFPWLAARNVDVAARVWQSEPAHAFSLLDRARGLDPLSDVPDTVAGAIAARIGDRARMQRAFAAAARRNPSNWYSQLELGLLAAARGDRAAALMRLREAHRLNPLDYPVALSLDRVQARKPVSIAAIDRLLRAEADVGQ